MTKIRSFPVFPSYLKEAGAHLKQGLVFSYGFCYDLFRVILLMFLEQMEIFLLYQ